MFKADTLNKTKTQPTREVLKNLHLYADELTHEHKEKAAVVVFAGLIASYIPFDNDPAAYYVGAKKVFTPSQHVTPSDPLEKKIWHETKENPELFRAVRDILFLKVPHYFGDTFALFVKNMYERDLAG